MHACMHAAVTRRRVRRVGPYGVGSWRHVHSRRVGPYGSGRAKWTSSGRGGGVARFLRSPDAPRLHLAATSFTSFTRVSASQPAVHGVFADTSKSDISNTRPLGHVLATKVQRTDACTLACTRPLHVAQNLAKWTSVGNVTFRSVSKHAVNGGL